MARVASGYARVKVHAERNGPYLPKIPVCCIRASSRSVVPISSVRCDGWMMRDASSGFSSRYEGDYEFMVGGVLFVIMSNYSLHPLAAGTGLLTTVVAITIEGLVGSLLCMNLG